MACNCSSIGSLAVTGAGTIGKIVNKTFATQRQPGLAAYHAKANPISQSVDLLEQS